MSEATTCRSQAPVRGALALCLLLALLAGAAAPASAQKSSGQITGSVVDPNGAALPDTAIVVTQVGTNLRREVNTNQDGIYSVPDLPSGTYRITATKTGFKEAIVENLTVNVATTTRQDLTMEVGQVGETVNIVASDVQIQQETGALGDVVTGEQVRELPLNGRSFVQLTQLQPGVSPAANFDSKNKGLFSGVDFSVNGNTTQSNLFLIDGANNNDTGSNRTILLYPSIEAIGEFTMLRNSFSPEYGQASGAIISIVTRGGENAFHGSLFYFGRNDALNAADYFANKVGGRKDKLRRNDFGGSIGGPIIKDRLFFFYSQEFNKEIRGQTRFGSVPTLAERRGDFSQPRFAPNGQRCSGPAIGNGRPGSDTQVIPQASLSPAGLALVNVYPEPNIPSPNDCNNWRESTNSPIDFREENVRIDLKVNNNHRLFGRYTQDHWENPAPILFNAGLWGDDAFPGVESSWQQPSRQAAIKLSSTIGGEAVNEVQFSYSANRINITPELGGDINESLSTLIPGFFPESIKLNEGQRAHPTFWGGIAPYGSNFGPDLWTAAPWKNALDIYSFRDDFSKVKGNQTFKLGFLYDRASKDEDSLGAAASESPQFWGACCANNSGNYLADILTRGSRFGFAETSTQPVALTRYRNFELYFGDTWKVRPNLTLELGTRYSYFPEPFDAEDRMSSFDLRFYDPTRPPSDFCNGLVVPPGTNPCAGIPGQSTPREGVNRALRENDKNAIAPRLGLAWDPFGNGKTAIRAGLGQFFQRERVSIALGMVANAPFALGIGGERTLDDNGPGTFVVSGPPGGAPSRSQDPSALLPNTWQWNLTVDQELWKDAVLEVGYVGNRALHQLISYDVNQVLPQNRVAAAFCPDGGCVNNLRPARNFGFIVGFARAGTADYHSMQTMFKTRLFGRSQLQAAYTWSHSIGDAPLDDSSGGASVNTRTDTYDGRIDRGNTGIHRPHIFVLNTVMYLPTFKGSNGFVRSALGGWEFATIYTASSGSAITPRVANGSISNLQQGGLAGTGTSQSNVRPNRAPGVPCRPSGGDPEQIINPEAFTLVGAVIGEPGDASRGSCLGPGINNVDMSFYKNFTPSWLKGTFGEAARVQFRLEFFNAFNHTQFRADSLQNNMFVNAGGNPVVCGLTPCSPTNRVITGFTRNGGFGRSGTTRGPREIQYALKLVF
ncbi:MAG TPA: carboxypeptidase regulatory-like domain-containing protein [Pyrinomonadaceae bacterium]|nr:carboxypeptidase regulatory-like domain-containing protein [Pyrinomonadaceae bacterium]